MTIWEILKDKNMDGCLIEGVIQENKDDSHVTTFYPILGGNQLARYLRTYHGSIDTLFNNYDDFIYSFKDYYGNNNNKINLGFVKKAIEANYDPISNYNMVEKGLDVTKDSGSDKIMVGGSDTIQSSGSDTVTLGGKDIMQATGTDKTQLSGSDTTNIEGKETTKQTLDRTTTTETGGFNHLSGLIEGDKEKVTGSPQDTLEYTGRADKTTYGKVDATTYGKTDTTTYGKTDSTKYGKTDTTTYGKTDTTTYGKQVDFKHYLERSGNIGITTNQAMILSEIELRQFDIIEYALAPWINKIGFYSIGGDGYRYSNRLYER